MAESRKRDLDVLANTLFNQLERLDSADLAELPEAIARSKAVAVVSEQIIALGDLSLRSVRVFGKENVPALLREKAPSALLPAQNDGDG